LMRMMKLMPRGSQTNKRRCAFEKKEEKNVLDIFFKLELERLSTSAVSAFNLGQFLHKNQKLL
jgi:hypothetical protein